MGMQILKTACYTSKGTNNGKEWQGAGEACSGEPILAAKAYIKGRGGNPCGTVFGVKAPVASWDVGVAVFPTKRKVTITGFVDDAPSYECYARAKDGNAWGPTVTLLQMPMEGKNNIAIELAGYSDRPVNPSGVYWDLPETSDEQANVVM